MFWQPAGKCKQSYHDYASFCPAKHDVYSVLSTEGGLNVNMGHIVNTIRKRVHLPKKGASLVIDDEIKLLWINRGILSVVRR